MLVTEQANEARRKNALLGGRPVGDTRLYAQKFREALAKRINDDSESWLDAIQDAAKGHWMVGKNGKTYKKAPDANAWKIAIDRSHGLLRQDLDLTSNGETLGAALSPAQAALMAKYEGELRDKLVNEAKEV